MLGYSVAENQCLLDDLKRNNGTIRREMFDDLHNLWPGLFRGMTRPQRGLFRQMVKLARQRKIPYTVLTAPIRNRKHPKYIRQVDSSALIIPKKTSPKNKFRQQVMAIIRSEQYKAEKKTVRRITQLVSDLTAENDILLAEVRELRTFKRDSEVTRNERFSPIMERHY